MLKTAPRLLRLLSLLQVRRFWEGRVLAERLDVTVRTLRRDVDRLRQLGYPVQSTSGVAGGYQLGVGASLPPLQFDDEEAVAVSIGLRTATRSNVAGVGEAAVRALVKLERTLPRRLQQRVGALRAIVPLERSAVGIDVDLLVGLAMACGERTRLRFRYESPRSGSRERLVEPAGLVDSGYRWYLVAWDVERADWRTFRVDRVRGELVTGEPFAPRPPPENGDLDKYVSRSISTDAYEVKARVVLSVSSSEAARYISPTAGTLEAVDEQRCILTAGARDVESLAMWITHAGIDFQVEEPPELVAKLRELHARLGRALRPRPDVVEAQRPSRTGRARTRASRARSSTDD